MRVGVRLAVGDCVGELVRLGVRVGLADGIGVGVAVRIGVMLLVAVAAPVAVRVGLDVRVDVGVRVAVWGGVAVTVGVGVLVGVGVDVARGVGVGGAVGSSPDPTKTAICTGTPGLPAVSSTRAVTIVCPSAKASSVLIGRQNCTWVPAATKERCAKALLVQATVGLPVARKRHPMSFKRSATCWSAEKLDGTSPPTPPSATSHTVSLPLPIDLENTTWMSGTRVASIALWSNTLRPTGKPAGPTPASTTSVKPSEATERNNGNG